jgi:hypothetical protein
MGTNMTEAEATLLAGMELIADYERQCELFPVTADIPLSSYLKRNLHQATQNVIKRNGNQAS